MDQYKSTRGQRLFILFLIFFLPLMVMRESKILFDKKNATISLQDTYYERNDMEVEDQNFLIVVPVTAPTEGLERNVSSIASQSYAGSRVEYILLHEEGNGAEFFGKVVKEKLPKAHIHAVHSLPELYQSYTSVVSSAPDNTVVIHLDGNDWFASEEALMQMNAIYRNQDVWLAYPQYITFPTYQKGSAKVHSKKRMMNSRTYRVPWVNATCKAYYARLFKQYYSEKHIPEEFYLSISSVDEMLTPVAESGRGHVRFISEVLYVHGDKNALLGNEKHRVNGVAALYADAIAELKAGSDKGVCDAVVFSSRTPNDLDRFLSELTQSATGLGHVFVFYEGDGYESCIQNHKEVSFFSVSGMSEQGLRDTVNRSLHTISLAGSYLLVSHDRVHIDKPLALYEDCVRLRTVDACAMYYDLNGSNEGFTSSLRYAATRFVGDGYYTWNLRRGKAEFEEPDHLSCTLYQSTSFGDVFNSAHFSNLEELIEQPDVPSHSGTGMFHITSSVFAK